MQEAARVIVRELQQRLEGCVETHFWGSVIDYNGKMGCQIISRRHDGNYVLAHRERIEKWLVRVGRQRGVTVTVRHFDLQRDVSLSVWEINLVGIY